MTLAPWLLRWRSLATAAIVVAASAWLALTSTAHAASDLQITRVDCQSHPRKIDIQNLGDGPQDLAGWKLQSDLPGEELDLGVIGTLEVGATVYVFNGHGSPEAPELAANDWMYAWNAGSLDFALWEDGTDFIDLVDPGGSVVSNKPCPFPPLDPSPPATEGPAPQPTPIEDPAGAIGTANAASNLQLTLVDCQGHPRRIGIQNSGNSAQNLTGWKLESDKPDEVFDLGVATAVGPGETFYVFNGHQAPLVPEQIGGQWIYGWKPSEIYDPSLFVLWEDGYDFVRIVDAGGNEVRREPCLIPAGWTPTPQPTQPGQATQPSSGNTGSTNTPAATQTDGAVQTVPGASNTGPGRGTAQTRGTGPAGEALGPPLAPSDSGVPSGGGPPFTEQSVPLLVMSLLAGAVLTLGGLLMVGLAVRRPPRDA